MQDYNTVLFAEFYLLRVYSWHYSRTIYLTHVKTNHIKWLANLKHREQKIRLGLSVRNLVLISPSNEVIIYPYLFISTQECIYNS